MEDRNHTAELFDTSFYLVEQEERIIRIALHHCEAKGVVCCLQGICCQEESMESFDKVHICNIKMMIWLSSAKMIDIILMHVALF